MSEREELLYRVARALDHSRQASEMQEATDQGEIPPENAAALHYDAAGLMEGVLMRVQTLHDRHLFEAKRMQREQRREQASGVEYRGGAA